MVILIKKNSRINSAIHIYPYTLLLYCFCLLSINSSGSEKGLVHQRPNVVFIAIDDLNDWVGCLGGNDQVKTPHLERFAQESVVFNKAYCPSSVCGPSRSSLLLGKMPSNTGVYGNNTNLKDAPLAKHLETLPEYFGNRGYHTMTCGKIFHKHPRKDGIDEGQWAFHEFCKTKGKAGLKWSKTPVMKGVKANGGDLSWGATKAKFHETKDYLSCKWGAEQLDRDFDGKPFFMALGISKPHLPWYVPQEFFDMYKIDDIVPAPINRSDFDDIIRKDGKPIFKKRDDKFVIADHNQIHKEANLAYLANVSYVDACLGVFFDAFRQSDYDKNTIVIIWGDHGWHLGEKMKYGKTWLWEESARVPLLVKVPGVTPGGIKSDGVVNLVDLYPTLIDLCGLPENINNDGRSFAQLLAEPKMEWNHPTTTTYNHNNHSITDGRFRYIYYGGLADGAEELYDHKTDPLEHTNLARNHEFKETLKRLKSHLPIRNEQNSPINKNDHLKKDKTFVRRINAIEGANLILQKMSSSIKMTHDQKGNIRAALLKKSNASVELNELKKKGALPNRKQLQKSIGKDFEAAIKESLGTDGSKVFFEIYNHKK